jgi:organic hydroperoxide reductase OsmC/OhrA
MHISAQVKNARGSHGVTVATGDSRKSLAVPCRDSGFGSAVNGGELLMLALATCYCNDLYREAARLGIAIDSVEVRASGDFEGVGLAARNITYQARLASSASGTDVARLLRETDAVAEIQNTLRTGAPVKLEPWVAGNAG